MSADSVARKKALSELALITSVLSQVPGAENRGAPFWMAVSKEICARHGLKSLDGQMASDRVVKQAERAEQRAREAEELLTLQHRKILTLLAQGMTVEQISTELIHPRHTIKSALARIYHLLDVRNGVHAVAVAMHHGLITLHLEEPV